MVSCCQCWLRRHRFLYDICQATLLPYGLFICNIQREESQAFLEDLGSIPGQWDVKTFANLRTRDILSSWLSPGFSLSDATRADSETIIE